MPTIITTTVGGFIGAILGIIGAALALVVKV
jgi:hypothetical protein